MEGFVSLVTQHGHLFQVESSQGLPSTTGQSSTTDINSTSQKAEGLPKIQQSESGTLEKSSTTDTDSVQPKPEQPHVLQSQQQSTKEKDTSEKSAEAPT